MSGVAGQVQTAEYSFMSIITEMAQIIARHTPEQGYQPCAIGGLWLIRTDTPSLPVPTVYDPSLCIIVQGAKTVSVGGRSLFYDEANYLIASVDLALVGHVVTANPDRPYLCCKIDLDPTVLAELIMAEDGALPPGEPPALAVHPSDPALLDAACRLLRLLDTPQAIPALAPLIQREILYRLLIGPHGAMLRHAASADSHLGQISRAIAWIREHMREQLRIADVARAARMSVSSLHQHFKTITGLTPLQYHKQLRLQEARNLMIAAGMHAGAAGFAVGYDSPSQFSREYRRLFGAPPRSDIARLELAPMLAAQQASH
jgi:AraC-like DNA-binding protein